MDEPVRGSLARKGEKQQEKCNGDPMKTYVMTTGALFGLLTLAHIWRIIEEGPHLATDPWYILITVSAAALCVWAWRVLRLSTRS
jgi:hypothetical protein